VLALLTIVMFCTPVPPTPVKAPSALVGVIHYADVDLRYARGEVSIVAVRPGRFARPTNLPRWRGRFLASVMKAKKTVADVGFDFPLVAPAESEDVTPDLREAADRLRKGVTSTTTVRVPLPEGAEAISIWDSATKKTVTAPLK
jgi:hypothetical protein